MEAQKSGSSLEIAKRAGGGVGCSKGSALSSHKSSPPGMAHGFLKTASLTGWWQGGFSAQPTVEPPREALWVTWSVTRPGDAWQMNTHTRTSQGPRGAGGGGVCGVEETQVSPRSRERRAPPLKLESSEQARWGRGPGLAPRAPERGEQGGMGAEGFAARSLHVREQG